MPFELLFEIDGIQQRYSLDRDEVVLGRSEDCDLVLNHAGISRHHARLFQTGNVWRVEDLGSTNGTRVRNRELDGPLQDGDVLMLGVLHLTFTEANALPVGWALDEATEEPVQTVFRQTVDFERLASRATSPDLGVDAARVQKLCTLVTEISRSILASKSLDDMFQSGMDLIFENLPVERGLIVLWDSDRGDFEVRCARNKIRQQEQISFSRTIARKVVTEGMAVLTVDAQTDERFAQRQSINDMGIRSAMAAPLWNVDQVSGLICVDTTEGIGVFSDFDLDILSAMGHHLAIAIEQSHLQGLALQKERLDQELAVAREIQMDTLPQEMPDLPGYDLFGMSRPATETGGDTFDMIPLPDDRLMLLVGDATGHGIGPALSATQTRSMLRVAVRLSADLDAAFRHINNQLVEDLADNRFVTAFLGVLETQENVLRYHSGGQGPIMHYQAEQDRFTWMAPTTMPLGFLPMDELTTAQTVELKQGDLLGLITDGVFEAQDTASGQFGIEGVERIIRGHHDSSAHDLAALLLRAVDGHVGAGVQEDDITIVLLRRL